MLCFVLRTLDENLVLTGGVDGLQKGSNFINFGLLEEKKKSIKEKRQKKEKEKKIYQIKSKKKREKEKERKKGKETSNPSNSGTFFNSTERSISQINELERYQQRRKRKRKERSKGENKKEKCWSSLSTSASSNG